MPRVRHALQLAAAEPRTQRTPHTGPTDHLPRGRSLLFTHSLFAASACRLPAPPAFNPLLPKADWPPRDAGHRKPWCRPAAGKGRKVEVVKDKWQAGALRRSVPSPSLLVLCSVCFAASAGWAAGPAGHPSEARDRKRQRVGDGGVHSGGGRPHRFLPALPQPTFNGE